MSYLPKFFFLTSRAQSTFLQNLARHIVFFSLWEPTIAIEGDADVALAAVRVGESSETSIVLKIVVSFAVIEEPFFTELIQRISYFWQFPERMPFDPNSHNFFVN